MAEPNEKAQSLNRVVRILECFSQERPELGVREVARLVELPSSVTGRLMLAMKDLGVLSQNPMTRSLFRWTKGADLGGDLFEHL